MNKLKCASFFAGVGGIDLGFEMTNKFTTIYANEIDRYPIKTFENNFKLNVDCKSIVEINIEKIPKFDVLLAGWPCTDISQAGYMKGFFDEKGNMTRSGLYMELVRIFNNKKPKIIFLENVKNLVSHDNGITFRIVCETLKDAGYYFKYKVLNAKDYGNVAQNRERIYIVAFRNKKLYEKFEFPLPIPLTNTIKDIINFDNKVDSKYYYTEGKYKGEIYNKLVEAMDDENAVYQWRRKYVRKNKSGVIPTLTANQGEGGHNVCLVKTKFGIRKMTPAECFYAQGFPKDYILPNDISDGKLYKQAGNSVCVSVIHRIAENIAEILY